RGVALRRRQCGRPPPGPASASLPRYFQPFPEIGERDVGSPGWLGGAVVLITGEVPAEVAHAVGAGENRVDRGGGFRLDSSPAAAEDGGEEAGVTLERTAPEALLGRIFRRIADDEAVVDAGGAEAKVPAEVFLARFVVRLETTRTELLD